MARAATPQFLFHAQYGKQTGLGHVVRCAALSLACRLHGAKTTLIEQSGTRVPGFFSSLYSHVLPEARAFEQVADCDSYLVVDGYTPDRGVLARSREDGLREVWICDDLDRCPDNAAFVLHPTFDTAAQFKGRATALLGPGFALLRPAFAARRAAAANRSFNSGSRRIFVSLGGTDANNLLPRLVPELLARKNEVTVALSELASSYVALSELASTSENLRLILNADDTEMAEETLRADVTIGNAGSSSFERCTLGTPAIVIVVADNQAMNAQQLERHGAAAVIGPDHDPDIVPQTLSRLETLLAAPDICRTMSSNAFQLCDGLGAFRAAGELLPMRSKDGQPVRLRPTATDDCRMIYDWQHLPETRAHARNPDPPLWDEHVTWFKKKLADPCSIFCVIDVDRVPCGVLRLDHVREGTTRPLYEVSIFLHPDFFGKGIASAALRAASLLVPFADIQATVLPDNERSLRLFEAVGYVLDRDMLIKHAAIDALGGESHGGGE